MEKNDKDIHQEDLNEGQATENMTDNQPNNDQQAADTDNLADDMENKFNELNDSYLRLHAEFDNYRKRTMKEKADLLKTGGEKAILGILPIVDDFERALPLLPEEAKEGVELIYHKFKAFLLQNGVKEINATGQSFDTELHEAMTTIPAQSEEQKNTVIDCVEKGYMLHDKVIRFAKVIVAK